MAVRGNAPPGSVEPLPPDDERVWAVLCHLSCFGLVIVAPLMIMLTLGTRSGYVRYHAVEALNFHITGAIAAVASGVLVLVIIGIFVLPLVLLVGLVLAIVAAIQAHRGQLYRYPLTLRLVT